MFRGWIALLVAPLGCAPQSFEYAESRAPDAHLDGEVSSNPSRCSPFQYACPSGTVCSFLSNPDVFKCSTPPMGIGVAPGAECSTSTDCGESQICWTIVSDAGAVERCQLFCWLLKPAEFTPGTSPDGRFPANGACTIGGTNYGTCTAIGGFGGGLGLCVKP